MLGRSHTLKSDRLRERRRKIFIGKIVLILSGVGVLWCLVFWLTGLSVITINAVSVGGAVSVSPLAVASSTRNFLTGRYLFTVPRSNILFYPKESIAENIFKSYPRVKGVEVGFKNFHTINVAITERETAALWCHSPVAWAEILIDKSDECFLADSQGFLFDRFDSTLAPNDAPSRVKFYGRVASTTDPVGQSYSSAERFQVLLLLVDELASFGVNVVAIRERPDQDFDVELSGGGRLVIGREPDTASVVSNLQSVISEPNFGGPDGLNKINYIDMRYGNKVFYKLR